MIKEYVLDCCPRKQKSGPINKILKTIRAPQSLKLSTEKEKKRLCVMIYNTDA